ncbi:AbrB/MazE/SpoVT family DNA-binding domain-containing protein [Desulfatitalea alkaliphila]
MCDLKPECVIVSIRGYIVLPAHIRREIYLKPGSRVLIHREYDWLT